MKRKSGIESLFEILNASGMDMSGMGGPAGAGSQGSGADDDGAGVPPRGATMPPMKNPFADLSKKAIIITVILAIVLIALAYWWFHPPINIHSVDTWAFVAICILLPIFLILRSKSNKYRVAADKSGVRGSKVVAPDEAKSKRFRILSWIPVAVVVVGVIGLIMSYPFFPGNAEKYANILPVQNSTFADDIQQVNYSEIPVIDHDSAVRLGNTQLGSISEYVSQFEISNLYSQINYNQEPVRVSPLDYADLFKWFTNRDKGLPAYVLVNMTTQEAQVVSFEGGEGMKYSQSEPLGRNIDRYVQLKYPFYMFDEKSFEIDDNGRPWWICPVQTRTIGLFGGVTIDRVVMVDAITGETQDLPIDECPQWVDRAYPADLLIEQYNWSGAYSGGFLNSIFGQQGVVRTTPGTDGMQGYNYIAKDDDVWVYTGVTSATADTSIVGFVLVNQRTGDAHFYSVSGATEDRAMRSAEGAVQDLGYNATFPILINIADRPTYFMSLKDGEGTVKQFAMVDIQSYQNVATGTTVRDTQRSYEALLASNGVASGNVISNSQEITGTIRSMTDAVLDGNSHFYVTLQEYQGVFDFALPGMIGIVGYQPGDVIRLRYVPGDTLHSVEEIITDSGTADTEPDQQAQDSATTDAGVQTS